MDFKVEILKHPTDEDWMLCKQCTLVTIGKEAKQPPIRISSRLFLRSQALSRSDARAGRWGVFCLIPYRTC